MPEYRVHLHAAETVANKMNFVGKEKDIFKLGTILPDAPWYDLRGENPFDSKYRLHRYNHNKFDALPVAGSVVFIRETVNRVGSRYTESPLITGFLFHLVLDAAFNIRFNRVVNVEDNVYTIITWSGRKIVKDSMDSFMEIKMRDISAFSQCLPYCPIESEDLGLGIAREIERLCDEDAYDIPGLIKMVNNEAENPDRCRNIIFTDGQYKDMISDGINEFFNLIG